MHVLACRGALTAQGPIPTRGHAGIDMAFRFHNHVGTLNGLMSQLHPSPTSPPVNASFLPLRADPHDAGNSVVRSTFTIWDLHPLCIASSPGALWTRPRCQGALEWNNTLRNRCRHISGLFVKTSYGLRALMKSALPLLITTAASRALYLRRVGGSRSDRSCHQFDYTSHCAERLLNSPV